MDALIQKRFFWIMKLNDFWGELTDISAKKEPLVFVSCSHLNENNERVLGGCVAGSIPGMNEYCMTSKHSNAFQYSMTCMFDVRHPMLNLKEGLQLPCSCQHRYIVFSINSWSGSCFKTLLENVIIPMSGVHAVVDISCTIVCWTDSMFCSDFMVDSIFRREYSDDSVIGCMCQGDSIYCNDCEGDSIFCDDCLANSMLCSNCLADSIFCEIFKI